MSTKKNRNKTAIKSAKKSNTQPKFRKLQNINIGLFGRLRNSANKQISPINTTKEALLYESKTNEPSSPTVSQIVSDGWKAFTHKIGKSSKFKTQWIKVLNSNNHTPFELINVCTELKQYIISTSNNKDIIKHKVINILVISIINIFSNKPMTKHDNEWYQAIYNILETLKNCIFYYVKEKIEIPSINNHIKTMLKKIEKANNYELLISNQCVSQLVAIVEQLKYPQDIVIASLELVKSICTFNDCVIFSFIKTILENSLSSSSIHDNPSSQIKYCCEIIILSKTNNKFDEYLQKNNIIAILLQILKSNKNIHMIETYVFVQVTKTFADICTDRKRCETVSIQGAEIIMSSIRIDKEIPKHVTVLLSSISQHKTCCKYWYKLLYRKLEKLWYDPSICECFIPFLNHVISRYDEAYQELVNDLNCSDLIGKIKCYTCSETTKLHEMVERYDEIVIDRKITMEFDKQRSRSETDKSISHMLFDDDDTNNQLERNKSFSVDSRIMKQSVESYQEQKEEINENVKTEHVPLHLLSAENICNKIKFWVYNDPNYKLKLVQFMKVFNSLKLDGTFISRLQVSAKILVEGQCKEFMTSRTINIIFDFFDKWKKREFSKGDNLSVLQSKSADDMAYILYTYPLNRLLRTIIKQQIDGKAFMNCMQQNNDFISVETGWDEEETIQLKILLFRDNILPKEQFKQIMDNILKSESLPDWVVDRIRNTLLRFSNIEHIQLQIKNGERVKQFSDSIIDMMDDLVDKNNENKQHSSQDWYFGDDFVKKIYESIAKCFVSTDIKYIGCDVQAWRCCNCGNYNVCQYIEGKMNTTISVCTLCGIKQLNSIILNIKRSDTFVDVNIVDENNSSVTHDGIENEINDACNKYSFDLSCPSRNDNSNCSSFKRLAEYLILYKRWINTVYAKCKFASPDEIIKIDPIGSIDNDLYKHIFMQCIQNMKIINEYHIKSFEKLFNSNICDIQNIKTFMNLNVKDFKQILKSYTDVKPTCAAQIRRKILKSLKQKASEKEFGAFLTDLQMENIQRDYYHIMRIHINDGDHATIENAFRFFRTVVHYKDTPTQIDECKVCLRKCERIKTRNTNTGSNTNLETKKTIIKSSNESKDKNIWTLKNNYNQNQLDTMHSYLVHSNWKWFIQRHSNEHTTTNANKYGQSADKSHSQEMYGFGVDHVYPHLKYVYRSIHTELLCNSIYPITENVFKIMLTKSIKRHAIIADPNYKYDLYCKRFDKQFGILRNELIGIRHLFAIIMYTDITQWCTAFRKTYRKIDSETSDKEVEQRHIQFYHYARALFSAVEFFGQSIPPNVKVYHGLDKVMYFNQYRGYFNQPISTISSVKNAQKFSGESGIVLTLVSGTTKSADYTKTPKYLSVSFLSDFPYENEKLVYGQYVMFQIQNITEGNLKGHADELLMLTKFQQTIQNQHVSWTNEQEMLNALITLINREKTSFDEKQEEYKESDDKYMSKYGKDLFHFFCTNENAIKIEIRKPESLPNELYNALFTNDRVETSICFDSITKLFPHLKEIKFNDLNMKKLEANAKKYMETIVEFVIQHKNISALKKENTFKLEKIVFQSEPQKHCKKSTTLKKLANENFKSLKKLKWIIEYEFCNQDTHTLSFSNYYIRRESLKTQSSVDVAFLQKYDENI